MPPAATPFAHFTPQSVPGRARGEPLLSCGREATARQSRDVASGSSAPVARPGSLWGSSSEAVTAWLARPLTLAGGGATVLAFVLK